MFGITFPWYLIDTIDSGSSLPISSDTVVNYGSDDPAGLEASGLHD